VLEKIIKNFYGKEKKKKGGLRMDRYTFGTTEEIFKLLHVVLCDDAPVIPVDAAVIHSETIVNKRSLLLALNRLWFSGRTENIAISLFEGIAIGELVVPGFDEMKESLLGMDIPEDAIFGIPLSGIFLPSTDAEAWGLVSFASAQQWKNLYLVAPPMHLFRMFYSVVSAVLKNSLSAANLRMWGYPCDIRAWNQSIVHSQSVPRGRRIDLLSTEMDKIEKYFQKGDLVSAGEVLKYIDERYA
jgi:hypothetical protein